MSPSPNDLTRQQLDELDALLQKMLAVPIATGDPLPVPKAYVPEPPGAGHWRMDAPTPSVARLPHLAPVPAHSEPAYAGVVRPERKPIVLETRVDPRSFLRTEPISAASSTRLFGPAEPMLASPESTFLPPSIQQRSVIVTPGPIDHSYREPLGDDPAITVEPPVVTFQPETRLPFNPYDDTAAVPLAMVSAPPAPISSGVPLPLLPVYGFNGVVEFVLCLFGPPGELFTYPVMKWVLGLCGIGLLGTAAAWTARGMGWVSW